MCHSIHGGVFALPGFEGAKLLGDVFFVLTFDVWDMRIISAPHMAADAAQVSRLTPAYVGIQAQGNVWKHRQRADHKGNCLSHVFSLLCRWRRIFYGDFLMFICMYGCTNILPGAFEININLLKANCALMH